MSRSRWANRGWRFHLGEISEGSYKGLDDSSWQSVCLPHDWSVSLPFSRDCSSGTGYLPGGIGWYRLRNDPVTSPLVFQRVPARRRV